MNLFAAGATLGGACFLYLAWRSETGRAFKACGWLLLMLSLLLWVSGSGAEFGVVYALFLIALPAWALSIFQFEWRERGSRTPQRQNFRWSPPSRIGLQIMQGVLLIPILGVVVVTATSFMLGMLTQNSLNRDAGSMMIAPAVWALLVYLYLISSRKRIWWLMCLPLFCLSVYLLVTA